MKIKIEVDRKPADMTQAEYHQIRRVANVLQASGHQVEIFWDGEPTKVQKEFHKSILLVS